jgi:hypothetical protein
LLAASGVFISFGKHRASAPMDFVFIFATVFALALYFLFAARTRPFTRRDVYKRSFFLFLLVNVYGLVMGILMGLFKM